MGRCNIKNKKTGLWRCWSTIVDDWVSDWLSEEDYKEWLITEAIDSLRYELDHYGIKESRYLSASECEYEVARRKMFCENCKTCDCDNCDKSISFEKYVAEGYDYLHIPVDE